MVTGSSGLIGRRAIGVLASTHLTIVESELLQPHVDLLAEGAVRTLLNRTHPDVVLHLAWVASGTTHFRHHPDNDKWVSATTDLAEMCRSRGIWFIGTGSVAEVDSGDDSKYANAKRAAWEGAAEGIRSAVATWLRPHYVFDPAAGRPVVMQEIQRAIMERRPPLLAHPHHAHDFIHIDDVATAIRVTLMGNLMGVIPIGSGQTRSVEELARCAGAEVQVSHEPTITMSPAADTSKLASVGWRPDRTEEFFNG